MREWRTFELGEVLTLQRGFDLPAQDRKAGNVPIVTSAGISGRHVEAKIKAPGVVTGRYGTVGQVYYITEDFWPHNTTLYVKDFKGNDPLFTSYLLRTIDFLSCSDKSGVPGVNRNHLHLIKVQIPEPKEQHAIASVLGALDDKIELNRRMNETLEALAQSLFKFWFVDATQSALPKGWRESMLGEVIDVKHGFAYQGEFFRGEPCRDILLTPGNFAIGGGFKEDKFKYYEGPTPDEYVLSEGDLLVTMTDLSKAGDTLGYGAILPTAPDGHRFHHNQRLGKVLIQNSGVINKPFLYQILRSHEYRAEILGGATGTTVKHTSPGRIKSFKFILPPASLMKKFGELAGNWHELAAHNRKESRTLAALRDALLPKLLSGELRVPVAVGSMEASA